MTGVQSYKERQVWLRIKLSVAAYAYEFDATSILTDAEFDAMCLEVDKDADTGNAVMDRFFKTEFDASTGQWIHKHPDLTAIKRLYEKFYKRRK